MKERPILFSGPMVKAILDDCKTMTRRVVKDINPTLLASNPKADQIANAINCSYGRPGDRLWVRETWCLLDQDHWADANKPKDWLVTRYPHPRRNAIAYRAETDADGDAIRREYGYVWRPSIFMPRWASRITLEITGLRVERLQEITAEDAEAEGFGFEHTRCDGECGATPCSLLLSAFSRLWDQLNGKKHPWDSNPWVWVVSFRRIK